MTQSEQRVEAPVVSPTTGVVLPGGLNRSRVARPYGHAVEKTGQKEWDFKKELQNKISWVLGTSYGESYSKRRDDVQAYAARVVNAVVIDHGYPNK